MLVMRQTFRKCKKRPVTSLFKKLGSTFECESSRTVYYRFVAILYVELGDSLSSFHHKTKKRSLVQLKLKLLLACTSNGVFFLQNSHVCIVSLQTGFGQPSED